MRLPNPICILRTLWWSIRTLMKTGYPASGHHYILEETHEDCRVDIFKCKTCGHVDVGWSKGGKQ